MEEIAIWIIVAILTLLIGTALIFRFVFWLGDFQHELKYLNNEIGRNTGSERKYWQKRKRRLLLSIIPFIRY